MCLYPRLIPNAKYRANKKNAGNVPKWKDPRVRIVAIGCGKCIECRKQYANSWKIRLYEEIKRNPNAKFVTLTFDEETLKKYENECKGDLQEIARLSVRRYLEKIRKKTGKSVKHWLISEKGHENTERLHLHGLIWAENELIEERWGNGMVWIGEYVNEKTINYITKYITKQDSNGYQGKILCSAGLGKEYPYQKLNDMENERYIAPNGAVMNLPIYYRNKRYTEDEREILWLKKLDQKKRYIRGSEIDESKYLEVLPGAQAFNERVGGGKIEWSEEIYRKGLERLKSLPIFAPTNLIT